MGIWAKVGNHNKIRLLRLAKGCHTWEPKRRHLKLNSSLPRQSQVPNWEQPFRMNFLVRGLIIRRFLEGLHKLIPTTLLVNFAMALWMSIPQSLSTRSSALWQAISKCNRLITLSPSSNNSHQAKINKTKLKAHKKVGRPKGRKSSKVHLMPQFRPRRLWMRTSSLLNSLGVLSRSKSSHRRSDIPTPLAVRENSSQISPKIGSRSWESLSEGVLSKTRRGKRTILALFLKKAAIPLQTPVVLQLWTMPKVLNRPETVKRSLINPNCQI